MTDILHFSSDEGEQILLARNDEGVHRIVVKGRLVASCNEFSDAYAIFCARVKEACESVYKRELGQ